VAANASKRTSPSADSAVSSAQEPFRPGRGEERLDRHRVADSPQKRLRTTPGASSVTVALGGDSDDRRSAHHSPSALITNTSSCGSATGQQGGTPLAQNRLRP
jgi:hypothetical protein